MSELQELATIMQLANGSGLDDIAKLVQLQGSLATQNQQAQAFPLALERDQQVMRLADENQQFRQQQALEAAAFAQQQFEAGRSDAELTQSNVIQDRKLRRGIGLEELDLRERSLENQTAAQRSNQELNDLRMQQILQQIQFQSQLGGGTFGQPQVGSDALNFFQSFTQ